MDPGSNQVKRRLYRGSEVARMLGISQTQLVRLVDEGKLKPVRLGERGWFRFRVDDIERLIAGERDGP